MYDDNDESFAKRVKEYFNSWLNDKSNKNFTRCMFACLISIIYLFLLMFHESFNDIKLNKSLFCTAIIIIITLIVFFVLMDKCSNFSKKDTIDSVFIGIRMIIFFGGFIEVAYYIYSFVTSSVFDIKLGFLSIVSLIICVINMETMMIVIINIFKKVKSIFLKIINISKNIKYNTINSIIINISSLIMASLPIIGFLIVVYNGLKGKLNIDDLSQLIASIKGEK